MDQVLQQLGIDRIFSGPYHPQSNEKLEVFHKYLKPTLKKLCENDPANWDKCINQVLASYRITPNLATAEPPFFLVYSRDPNLPLHQLLEPMQCFLGDPDLGKLHLETHRLALAIAKKTLDENRFTATQKTVSRDNPTFKVGDRVYFKNKQPGKWDLKWRHLDTGLFVLSAMDITSTSKTKLQEEHDHAMSRISFLNLPLSSGTLTPNLAEPVAISIIHPIYLQFISLIPQTSVPVTLHTLHTSASTLFLIYITA